MGRRMTARRATAPALVLATTLAWAACAPPTGPDPTFDVTEASIPALRAALESGRVTSVVLVDLYLARIGAYDDEGPALNTIIRLNPLARQQAEALDSERSSGTVRGPLHGIPVLMKDNYDVAGMPTTPAFFTTFSTATSSW